jgi:hypothetical protein
MLNKIEDPYVVNYINNAAFQAIFCNIPLEKLPEFAEANRKNEELK